jgi:hypothetical protein
MRSDLIGADNQFAQGIGSNLYGGGKPSSNPNYTNVLAQGGPKTQDGSFFAKRKNLKTQGASYRNKIQDKSHTTAQEKSNLL